MLWYIFSYFNCHPLQCIHGKIEQSTYREPCIADNGPLVHTHSAARCIPDGLYAVRSSARGCSPEFNEATIATLVNHTNYARVSGLQMYRALGVAELACPGLSRHPGRVVLHIHLLCYPVHL